MYEGLNLLGDHQSLITPKAGLPDAAVPHRFFSLKIMGHTVQSFVMEDQLAIGNWQKAMKSWLN